MKKFIDYYPNSVAKQNDFLKHSKDRERFTDYCLGKYEHWYQDDSNYGYSRNTKNFTEIQRVEREYLYAEFGLWNEWRNAGSNIFDFSENLLSLLKDTDVSDIELSFIRLPYQSLYLDLSQANLYFDTEKTIPIEGVFIYEDTNDTLEEEITYERVISFAFTGKYIENFRHINSQLMELVRGFHTYSLYVDPKSNIHKVGQSIADSKETFIKVRIAEEDIDTQLDLYKIHSDFIKSTVNLVINCLLYLSLKDNDIQEKFTSDLPIHLKTKLEKANTKKRKELALKDIKQSGFTKIKFVGNTIKKVEKFVGSTNQISPHWRRGHWRNQKFGEQLQEKKLIWILPTIVNKDKGTPTVGHIYNVDKEKLQATLGLLQFGQTE